MSFVHKVIYEIGAASGGHHCAVRFALEESYGAFELTALIYVGGEEKYSSWSDWPQSVHSCLDEIVSALKEIGVLVEVANNVALCPKCNKLSIYVEGQCVKCLKASRKLLNGTEKPSRPVVYWIKQVDAGIHKVGWSRFGAEKRRGELLTSSPAMLESVMQIECANERDAIRLEEKLHRILASFRVNGEWFSCNSQTISSAFLGEVDTGTSTGLESFVR